MSRALVCISFSCVMRPLGVFAAKSCQNWEARLDQEKLQWAPEGSNIDLILSQHGSPEAPWSPLAGSWAASKIDSRREQNRTPRGPKWRPGGLRGLLGARCAPDGRPGRSETACGRLLWPSGRLLGSSWGALGASWGPLGPPGGLPGGSRGSSGRSFWKVFLKSSPRSGKITRC